MINAPPSDVRLLDNQDESVNTHWADWLEDVEHHINLGELPLNLQEIFADVGIPLPGEVTNVIIRVISATSGILDITASPQIEFGFDGQFITIEGMDDTRTVKLDDGNGLKLVSGSSAVLKDSDTISFHFNAEKKLWIENGRAIS